MFKFILVVLLTVVIVTFSIANSHHVPMSLIFGAPIRIRLVFLLLSTFFIGMAVPIFHRLIKGVKDNKEIKRERKRNQIIQREGHDLLWENDSFS